jgi:septal ring factor EnvC (AmiA/AmiB activator)
MVEKEKDIVERLREAHENRDNPWAYNEAIGAYEQDRSEAADEMERLTRALEMQKQASRDVAATYTEQEAEIERLEHMQANLHGHIKRLENENAKLIDEIERLRERRDKWCKAYEGAANESAKLREALDWIADTPMKWTKPQGDVYWANMAMALAKKADDARAALQKDET